MTSHAMLAFIAAGLVWWVACSAELYMLIIPFFPFAICLVMAVVGGCFAIQSLSENVPILLAFGRVKWSQYRSAKHKPYSERSSASLSRR